MTKNNKQEKKKTKKKTRKYTSVDGISDRQLNIGLWFIENRKKIKQGLIIFLIFFAASTLSYSTYHLTDYFLYGQKHDQKIMQEMSQSSVDSEFIRQVMSPDNLFFSFTDAFYVDGRYDFMTKIKNPNPRHRAFFTYCFEEVDRQLACGESFILPGQDKYVLELNEEISGGVGAVNFVIKDISWRRITAHMIDDWESYKKERFRFRVSDVDFNIANNNYYLEFAIANNSSFNFYEVPLQIILIGSRGEIGANQYTVTNLKSEEKTRLSITWPTGTQRASQVLIIPDVNILDEDNYMPY